MVAPAPSGSKEAISLLSQIEPESNDIVECGDDASLLFEEYSSLLDEQDKLSAKVRKAKTKIIAAIGHNEGISNGSMKATYKWSETRRVNKDAIIDDLIEMLGEKAPDKLSMKMKHTVAQGSRRFEARSLRSPAHTHDEG